MALIHWNARAHFADGVLEEALRAEVEALGVRRPMIVTDPGLARLGVADRAASGLHPAGLVGSPIARPRPNGAHPAKQSGRPPVIYLARRAAAAEDDAVAAAALYADEGCDGLIGLGGGLAIDLAKATALLATHPGPLARYAADDDGGALVRDRLPPLIAAPTTAGSGSDLSASALVMLSDGRKVNLHSAYLRPLASICDPTLTLSLSPEATACSGMHAVSHCIEAYLSPAFNPPADGVALDGLTRAARHLERAVADGENRAARREMMAAALNGALAFSKGLGSAQAATVALSAATAIEGRRLEGRHGVLKAILLPHVLAYNAPAAEHRYDALARAMGATTATLPDAVAALAERVRLPTRLSALGVDAAAIDRAAALAERDRASSTNPRRLGVEDYRAIMLAAQ